jgi:hypothetical protein
MLTTAILVLASVGEVTFCDISLINCGLFDDFLRLGSI